MSDMYKKLILNREKIITEIERYCEIHEYVCEINRNFNEIDTTRNRLKMNINGKKLYIDFHFNSDGTTTIEDFGGTEIKIKREICAIIKETCEVSNGAQNQWFVVNNVSQTDFVTVVDMIKDSSYCKKILCEKPDEYLYQYEGAYGEKLTIRYYNQKSNKVVIQGKPLLLYLDATEIVSELVDFDGIPQVLNENFKVAIDKDSIIGQTKILMEHSYDNIWSIKLKKCILQAVYYMNLNSDMFDYTGIAFHGYRALEGHMRYVLNENGITLTGHSFNIFTDKKDLQEVHKKEVLSHCEDAVQALARIKYIEETYKYFGDKRHAYFHWNNPNSLGLDDTAVIDSKDNAQGLVKESLGLIEKYFVLFK